LRHTPAAYHPEAGFEKQVSPYLTHQLMPQFYNGLQRKEPFELIIDQKGLNEAITAMGWPKMYDNGLIISTPSVFFTHQKLWLMAKVNLKGFDTVVTVEISPQFDANGLLSMNVEKIKIGALSVTYIAKKMAQKMFDEHVQFVEADNISSLALASAMTGRPFEPVFKADGKKAKIDKVVLENEVLRIYITPVGKVTNK
jgi:transcriptional regulator of aromatic amino acid metabolism